MQCEVSSRLQPTNNPAVVVVVEVVVVVVQTCFSQTHSLPTSSTQDKQSNLACYWLDAVWLWFQWCAHSLIMMQQPLCPEACNTLQQSWWWGIVCRKLQPVRARVWLWVILCWALYTNFLASWSGIHIAQPHIALGSCRRWARQLQRWPDSYHFLDANYLVDMCKACMPSTVACTYSWGQEESSAEPSSFQVFISVLYGVSIVSGFNRSLLRDIILETFCRSIS